MKRSIDFLFANVECKQMQWSFARQEYEDALCELEEALKQEKLQRCIDQKIHLLKNPSMVQER